jgi:hypothetical protein
MAKSRSQKRTRAKSKTKTMRRSQRGGDLAGNPPSAWGWTMGTLGNGWTQFMNSLTLQPGQNLGAIQSNNIVPVGAVNAQNSQPGIGPNMQGAIPAQAGGKRRKSRAKRGGNLLAVAEQAVVPVTLFAMNNAYGKRSRSRTHSRRRH